MKQIVKPAALPAVVTVAGVAGLLLRYWLYTTGTDDRGLLVSGHMAGILLWALTAVVVALVFLGTRFLVKGPKYGFNYPASIPGAIGAGLGAVGILMQAAPDLLGGDRIGVITGVLGILAAAGVGVTAMCRWRGQRVSVIFHVLACVYLMLRLVCLYRVWCADPQLMDYAFSLFAMVCLMLSVYYRACFDAGMGKRRPLAFFHLCAVFFCLAALYGSGSELFYLFTAVWMLTDLCNLSPFRPRQKKG